MARFRGVYGWSNRARARSVLPAVLVLAASFVSAAEPSLIKSVALSKPFFNPTIGQTIGIDLEVGAPGSISILILDRDGYPVRRLVSAQPIQTGRVGYEWNGRDDAGAVVPDEAYSLKIDFVGENGPSSYFPASQPARVVPVQIAGYDRLTAVLSYKLSSASRVHAQAGVSRLDPKTQKRDGPVLKTLVNREPRPGGAVVENWDGFDETGETYVPDLPDFAYAVSATSLPENALITIGNSSRTFLESVAADRGRSLIGPSPANDHAHHKGLTSAEDASPTLRILPDRGRWSEGDKVWLADGGRFSATVSLEGATAAAFARQPGDLMIFIDGRRVREVAAPVDGSRHDVLLRGVAEGEHIVAFNWASRYGPVAVSAIRVRIGDKVHPEAGAPAAGAGEER